MTLLDLRGSFDFEGMAVVVTGGSRGVGHVVCRAFLDAGAQVVTCGRHPPEPDQLPRRADGKAEATFVTADVRQPHEAARVIEVAHETLGRVDVLVNNAGGAPAGAAAKVAPRLFEAVVKLNLLAPFYCAQAANSIMQGQDGGGVIVNVGSVAGSRPSPGSAAYGAAKAGLANLTQTLAVEWAPRVRVNCVTAGLLDTGAGADHYGGDEGLAAVAATVPLGRMGTPADVAGVCLFLASPLAGYVSGAEIVAHGGGEWPAYLRALGH